VVPENAQKAAIIIEPRQHYGKFFENKYMLCIPHGSPNSNPPPLPLHFQHLNTW
jgi:hypothetical protein